MGSDQVNEKQSGDVLMGNGENNSAEKSALIINVQSWATPIVGLLMLVIGLSAGYFGRPFVADLPAKAPTEVAKSQQGISPSEPIVSSGDGGTLMDKLVSQTRHFKGDPNAPVTIIEFSDFQ